MLRVPGYVRYVDDFILFGPARATLHHWGKQCLEYLAARRMELHPDKYRLCRTAEGVDFCGFVVRADGRVRLRSSGVRRFRKRYLRIMHEWKAGQHDASKSPETAGSMSEGRLRAMAVEKVESGWLRVESEEFEEVISVSQLSTQCFLPQQVIR